MTRVLNYSDVVTLTEAAAGAGATQLFRTGDVYDPDYTGVGHQPMYFDQLCTSVGPYLVFSCPRFSADLRFSNTSAYPVLVVVLPSMYTTAPVSRTQAAERPYGWKHLLAPNGTGGATIQKKFDLNNAAFVGVPETTYFASYAGNFSASAACPYLQIQVWGIGGIGSVAVQVNLKFTTRFWQLGAESSS